MTESQDTANLGTDPDTPATSPAPSHAPAPTPATVVRKSADERKQLLAQTLQTQIAGGARIESQSDYQAVLVSGHRVNHLLHFLIGFPTLFFWWLIWIGIAIIGGEKRSTAQVDEFGNVNVQRL